MINEVLCTCDRISALQQIQIPNQTYQIEQHQNKEILEENELTEILNISKIKDGFYVGDNVTAISIDVLIQFKITHLVNSTGNQIMNQWESVGLSYLTLNWSENPNQKLFDPKDEIAERIVTFIDNSLQNGEGVLAHSFKGQNRVCLVVLIYLMKKYHWSLNKSMDYLKSKKQDVEIMPSFWEQMVNFEKRMIQRGELVNDIPWDYKGSNISDEEKLLNNTYINGLPSKKLDNIPKISNEKMRHIKWIDDPYLKGNLEIIDDEHDLFLEKEIKLITSHKRINPIKECIKKYNIKKNKKDDINSFMTNDISENKAIGIINQENYDNSGKNFISNSTISNASSTNSNNTNNTSINKKIIINLIENKLLSSDLSNFQNYEIEDKIVDTKTNTNINNSNNFKINSINNIKSSSIKKHSKTNVNNLTNSYSTNNMNNKYIKQKTQKHLIKNHSSENIKSNLNRQFYSGKNNKNSLNFNNNINKNKPLNNLNPNLIKRNSTSQSNGKINKNKRIIKIKTKNYNSDETIGNSKNLNTCPNKKSITPNLNHNDEKIHYKTNNSKNNKNTFKAVLKPDILNRCSTPTANSLRNKNKRKPSTTSLKDKVKNAKNNINNNFLKKGNLSDYNQRPGSATLKCNNKINFNGKLSKNLSNSNINNKAQLALSKKLCVLRYHSNNLEGLLDNKLNNVKYRKSSPMIKSINNKVANKQSIVEKKINISKSSNSIIK